MEHAVLSYGLGVDSTAVILRWIFRPETRPCPLENITVITSMTGDEFLDTARDVFEHILPLFRKHRIRFVQVARRGPKEADGITVLSDTRCPETLYIKGDYKLSDELAAAGVVPSFSGAHICSLKAKAVPIETWLANHYDHAAFGHAFGYSAEETKRVEKSEAAFLERNVAFGFNSDELARIQRAKEYDHAGRRGFYPLVEWGWDRQTCLDYILVAIGVEWKKSACVYCPFAHNKKNLVQLQARQISHPEQTADALMLEHMSLALNPRGTLYRSESLMMMTRRVGNAKAMSLFERMRDEDRWAIYRVRRLYAGRASEDDAEPAKKGTVQRAVEKEEVFAKADEALSALRGRAEEAGWDLVLASGIQYAYVEYRKDSYPTREEYYVAAPARVETKTRYGVERFNAQWEPQQFDIDFPACA